MRASGEGRQVHEADDAAASCKLDGAGKPPAAAVCGALKAGGKGARSCRALRCLPPAGLPTGDFGWGSKTFAKMGRKKINLIARFLELGVKVSGAAAGLTSFGAALALQPFPRVHNDLAAAAPAAGAAARCRRLRMQHDVTDAPSPPLPAKLRQVVISDVDVLWLRNPLPFFNRFPGADVLTSSDHLVSTVGKAEELERYPEAGSAFNIGIMLFQEKSLPFVKQWIKVGP
jgi:hypothetical protein